MQQLQMSGCLFNSILNIYYEISSNFASAKKKKAQLGSRFVYLAIR